MDQKDKNDERPVAYPKPTATDEQLKNQPEFIDEEPNHYQKEISDVSNPEQLKNSGDE